MPLAPLKVKDYPAAASPDWLRKGGGILPP
jgi:hypothetical protein